MRRAVLVLALAAALAVVVVLVVRHRGGSHASTDGAAVVHFTVHRLSGGNLHELLVVPRRHGRTLLVVLQGRDGGPSSWLGRPFFDELRALGPRAPSVLLLDRGAMRTVVLGEEIPAGIARTHARRVALGGIGTGGDAALALGTGPGFCAVGAHSPTLPRSLLEAARRSALYGSRVWIDVGSDDPARADVTRLTRLLERQDELVEAHVWPGGHDEAYWQAHVADYLRFYASACG